MQHRRAHRFDPPLLHQLAMQRVEQRLADLDPSARQVPAGDIAVLDQKHLVVGVEHYGADPQRHAADQPPIEVEHPPSCGSNLFLRSCRAVTDTSMRRDMTFDPCADAVRLPIDCRIDRDRREMTGRTRYITGDPTEALSDGGIHAGASVRSASAAAARGAAARSRGKTRARLSQLDAQPPQISSPRRAGRAGFGHAGSRRPDHIAITGDLVNLALEAEFAPAQAWLESVGAPDQRDGDSRQSRRLCARHAASLRENARRLSARRCGR